MFERFTEGARKVVNEAQVAARELHHTYIGTEHLLLGVLRISEEPAGVLAAHGVTLEAARARVVAIVPSGTDEPHGGQIPFTPRAKKVLELALREAKELHCDYIGAGHIVLGLVREGEGVGAHVLRDLSGDFDALRTAIVETMPAGERKVRRFPGHREAPVARAVPEAGFLSVTPSPEARLLLMRAAARALDDGRTEIEVRDLREALRRHDEPPEAQAI